MNTVMRTPPKIFDVEFEDGTMVLTPREDLRELRFLEIGEAGDEVLRLLERTSAVNVVLDLRKTDFFGSTALGYFVRLGEKVRSGRGRMALANVSAHEKEILRLMNLDRQWPICASRAEAVATVRRAAHIRPRKFSRL